MICFVILLKLWLLFLDFSWFGLRCELFIWYRLIAKLWTILSFVIMISENNASLFPNHFLHVRTYVWSIIAYGIISPLCTFNYFWLPTDWIYVRTYLSSIKYYYCLLSLCHSSFSLVPYLLVPVPLYYLRRLLYL